MNKLIGWVDGNLYIKTNEVAGILPIPEDVRTGSGMLEYIPSLDRDNGKRIRHQFLAERQGVKKPALPVHTSQERETFRTLMQESPAFSMNNGSPNWKAAVKVWNSLASEDNRLTYKVTAASSFVVELVFDGLLAC